MIAGFELEATARCNLDCRHCAISRPETDKPAKKREPTVDEIARWASQAAALGATRCLITGGEPFLRKDIHEIYQAVLSKGLLVSFATNATLISGEDVRLLKKFPPREVEVAVFGATREAYERVTRTPGSFAAFKAGLDRLLGGGITVGLKVMVLRSNKHEIAALGDFCRAQAGEAYCFEPHLHLRFDRDEARNVSIRAERLSPKEIVRLERSAGAHVVPLDAVCAAPAPEARPGAVAAGRRVFGCGAGRTSFVIGPSGLVRPCPALHHPDFLYDLRSGSLDDALNRFLPAALSRETDRRGFPDKCGPCPVAALCLRCPARAHLETGRLDLAAEVFCAVAEARSEGL